MSGLIRRYLDELNALLRCGEADKAWILAEVEDHLLESVERERAGGASEGEAARRAVLRFGPPEVVARAFMESLSEEGYDQQPERVTVRIDETAVIQPERIAMPREKGGGDMWQRFTERTRRVLFFAQEEAARLAENHVGTEHLLMGLVRENDSLAARILEQRLGVPLDDIRRELSRHVAPGKGHNMGQEMELTPRSKRVIDLAYEEARSLNHNYLGSEHLLLGLLREGEGIAGRVLHGLGADYESARQAVLEMQGGGESPNPPRPLRPFEVLRLETDSGPRVVPVDEIASLRITTTSGETLEGRWSGVEVHPSREPFHGGRDLGEILVERGQLTERELKQARQLLVETPGANLGQILAGNGYATEKDVTQARALSINLRFVDLETMRPSPGAVEAVPKTLARKYALVPVMKRFHDLMVALADPNRLSNPDMMDELRLATGCRITFAVAVPSSVQKAIDEEYGRLALRKAVEEEFGTSGEGREEARSESLTPERVTEIGDGEGHEDPGRPIRRVALTILQLSLELNASEVHVVPESEGGRVLYRIDGELQEEMKLPRHLYPPLIACYKAMAGMDLAECGQSQEGRIRIAPGPDKDYSFRVTSHPAEPGEKVVLVRE